MKKGNVFRNGTASVILAGASVFAPVFGAEISSKPCEPVSQKRVLELEVNHPFATSESRAKATYSANQIIDYVLDKSEEDSLVLRLAKTAGDFYGSYLTAYISHEAGHEGKDLKFEGGLRSSATPRVALTKKELGTPQKRVRYFSSGVNQNSLNANLIWENGQRYGNFDDSGFLFNSLYGAFYSADGNTRSDGNAVDDLEGYCEALGEIGVRETPKGLKRKSQIASALTLQNYASIWNVFNYAVNGRTNAKPLVFEIKGIEMTPPVFSHFLTDEGSYFQGDIFLNPRGNHPVKISAGIQDEKFRAGAKVYDFKPTDKLGISPYVFADTSGGHSVGCDAEYRLTNNFDLTARIEHNQRDILESGVKDKGNGINAVFGFKAKF